MQKELSRIIITLEIECIHSRTLLQKQAMQGHDHQMGSRVSSSPPHFQQDEEENG